jgi:DNA-binding transcriptional ArsR family regulator
VQQCVERTGLVQSLVSKHLRTLMDAGLVQRRPSGRRNYYSVSDPDRLTDLLAATERLARRRPGTA